MKTLTAQSYLNVVLEKCAYNFQNFYSSNFNSTLSWNTDIMKLKSEKARKIYRNNKYLINNISNFDECIKLIFKSFAPARCFNNHELVKIVDYSRTLLREDDFLTYLPKAFAHLKDHAPNLFDKNNSMLDTKEYNVFNKRLRDLCDRKYSNIIYCQTSNIFLYKHDNLSTSALEILKLPPSHSQPTSFNGWVIDNS